MALRFVVLALVVARMVSGLRSQAKCGPQTKLFLSDSEDAAGTPQYTQETIADGQCVSKGVDTITHVKFCGPGTLTLSRMSCGRHDYKAHTVTHSSTEYTTGCEVIDAKGTVVEGYFGSAIVKC